VVKSFVKEWWFLRKFAATNEDYQRANMQMVKLFGGFFPFVTLLSGCTTLIVLWVGGGKVIRGEMSPGELAAFFSYVNMLIWPIIGMGFTVTVLQRGAASMARLNELFAAAPSIKQPTAPRTPNPAADPAIELRHLTFTYPAPPPSPVTANVTLPAGADADTVTLPPDADASEVTLPAGAGADKVTPAASAKGAPEGSRAVLRDVSFAVPKGALVGIFGRTGSGKSTLLKSLVRLVDPPAGTVIVGGVDVGEADMNALRGLFGMVPQDTYLFSDSIRNNISYTQSSPDNGQVLAAAQVAALDKDLALFADRWDTVVGERGLTLSGGQKQRTAIARALNAVEGSPEILLLDDAMSAVDMETEERIIAALLAVRRGRTTIMVSHRVSTMQHADLVAVLDQGRLVQWGTPADLLAEDGPFQAAAKLQGEMT
jgi:ATP-binding cassette subfamily B protein